jgi:hypothetical protein
VQRRIAKRRVGLGQRRIQLDGPRRRTKSQQANIRRRLRGDEYPCLLIVCIGEARVRGGKVWVFLRCRFEVLDGRQRVGLGDLVQKKAPQLHVLIGVGRGFRGAQPMLLEPADAERRNRNHQHRRNDHQSLRQCTSRRS